MRRCLLQFGNLTILEEDGRYFALYDAGSHQIVMRKDELTKAEVDEAVQSHDDAEQVLLGLQKRLLESGVDPFLSNTVETKPWGIANGHLDAIEVEMQRLGVWKPTPLQPEACAFVRPFAMDTMTFPEWLQFVFLPRARELALAGGPFPRGGSLATMAIREFDGLGDSETLVSLLSVFESWIESSYPV